MGLREAPPLRAGLKSQQPHCIVMIWTIFDLFGRVDSKSMSDKKSEKYKRYKAHVKRSYECAYGSFISYKRGMALTDNNCRRCWHRRPAFRRGHRCLSLRDSGIQIRHLGRQIFQISAISIKRVFEAGFKNRVSTIR